LLLLAATLVYPITDPAMSKTFRIAALSVAPSELEQIKSLMHGVQMDIRWEWIADSASADVLLIDVDSLYGHMDWLKAHAQSRRVICLTASSMSDKDIMVARPISSGGLQHALRLVIGEDVGSAGIPPHGLGPVAAATPARVTGERPLVAKPVAPNVVVRTTGERPLVTQRITGQQAAVGQPITGQRPAVPAHPTATPMAAAPTAAPATPPAPKPSAGSLADFLLAGRLPEAAALSRPGLPTLILDPAQDRYYSGLTLKPLLPYCRGQILHSEWKPVPAAELEKLRDSGAGLPLSRLVWLYAMGTSNGTALLAGLDQNARFKLLKWPQIEREFPKHFRIATAMMKAATALTDVAELSGAALAEVYDFVNAYAAIGFVAEENQPALTDHAQVLERLHARAR